MRPILAKLAATKIGGAIVRAIPLLKTIKNATLGNDKGEKIPITTEWWFRFVLEVAAVIGVLWAAKCFGVTPESILDLLKQIATLGLA